MAGELQVKRGTTAEVDAYTGPAGEPIFDTTTNELVIQDGTTMGGHRISPATFSGDASDIPFDPAGTDLSAEDVQAAIEEIDTTLSGLGSLTLASQAEAEAGTDNEHYMSALRTSQAIAEQAFNGSGQTLTFADPTTAWDATAIPHAVLTLTADTTLTVSNVVEGHSYILRVVQDGTGGWTITFSTGFTTAAWSGLSVQLAAAAETFIEALCIDGELVPANLLLLGNLAARDAADVDIGDFNNAGALAEKNTVAQADIDTGAVTGDKLNDNLISALTEESSPATGDWALLELAEGGQRKVDFSNIGTASGVGSYPDTDVAGTSDAPVGETWRRYTSSTTTLVVLTSELDDEKDAVLHNRGTGVFSIVATTGNTINDVAPNTADPAADLASTSSSGANTTFTGAATLPLLVAGDYFEVTDFSVSAVNGWYVATGSPTTSSLPATKLIDADGAALTNPSDQSAEAANIQIPTVLTLESLAVVRRDGTNFTVSGGTSEDKDFDGSLLTNAIIGDDITFETAATTVTALGLDDNLVAADANNDLTVNPLFWSGTETEYSGLTPNAGTLYFVIADA